MEEYFLIPLEDDEYSKNIEYDDMAFEYCVDSLDIPEEKIEAAQIANGVIELELRDLEADDFNEDWYVNLFKISKNTN